MSTFDSLDETFDIVPSPVEKQLKKQKPLVLSDKSEDRDKDYQHVRASLYNLVDKMQEALDGALEVAQQSDHPRAYEVFLQGAKNTAEVAEKLTDLHKKVKDLEVEEVKVQQTNTTNNNVFFSGSTTEMLKALKETQQGQKET